jgi:hypothetical protein
LKYKEQTGRILNIKYNEHHTIRITVAIPDILNIGDTYAPITHNGYLKDGREMKTFKYLGKIYLRNSRDNLQMNDAYDINKPIVQTLCKLHVT